MIFHAIHNSLAIMQIPRLVPSLPLPPPSRITSVFFKYFEIAAIVFGALGGALTVRRMRRSRYDFFGLLGLGLISGVGGGIVRDILLGDGPPLSLEHPDYLAYALIGAAIAILFGRNIGPGFLATMNFADALALGLFTVAGSTRAQNAGLGFLPALMLGVITAVGGGALRDLFSGRTIAIFQEGELYALASAACATVFLFIQKLGIPQSRAAGIGTFVGFALRTLAIHYGWRTRAIGSLSSARSADSEAD
jgi:uncharacterized membrane protein YeiH